MKVNFNDEENDSVVVAMEVGYQALVDLTLLYKDINDELLKRLAIFEGKSVKDIKKEINNFLPNEITEKDLLLQIKASQEIITRFNNSLNENKE